MIGGEPEESVAIGRYQKLGFVEYATGVGGYPQMKLKIGDLG